MAVIKGNDLDNSLPGTSLADLIQGFGGNDTIGGGSGTDSIWGGEGNDWADGGAWDDRVYGEAGSDTLVGGGGNDYLNGGADDDSLAGGDGNDTMDGGDGADSMAGGLGNDVYVMDGAIDTVVELAGGGIDEIQFGNFYVEHDYYNHATAIGYMDLAGTNIENMTYTAGTYFWGIGTDVANVIRSNGYSTVWAMGGNDLVVTTGSAWIDAGTGNDTVQGGAWDESVTGGAGNDVIQLGGSDDFGAGDAGNDSLDGGTGNDTLAGGAGSDTLSGGDGNDLLTSRGTMALTWGYDAWGWGTVPTAAISFDDKAFASGNDGVADTLLGGAGNDTLVGFNGDLLVGGADNDTYHIFANSPATIVETADGGTADRLIVHNVGAWVLGENLESLFADNDSVTGGAILTGNDADNRITGSRYDDVVQGDAGNDEVIGYLGNDTVRGGDGNDTVDGHEGNDSLEGGNGDDLLVGGKGTDVLRGGAGADIFRFGPQDGSTNPLKRDLIADFVRGEDKVDLSGIQYQIGGVEPLHLADGAEAFGVWQGFDKPKASGGIIAQPVGTRLMLDINGDAVADAVITVQFGDGLGVGTLAATDFIL